MLSVANWSNKDEQCHLWDSCQISSTELQHRGFFSLCRSFFGLIDSNTAAAIAQHIIPNSKLGIAITQSYRCQCEFMEVLKEVSHWSSTVATEIFLRSTTRWQNHLELDHNETRSRYVTWFYMEMSLFFLCLS